MGCSQSSSKSTAEPVDSRLPKIDINEEFLTHHLRKELAVSSHARADLIRRRQIIEHNYSEPAIGRMLTQQTQVSLQLLIKSWLQRLFLQSIQDAERQFFHDKIGYDIVRRKIAERFLLEITGLTEFLNSGLLSIQDVPSEFYKQIIQQNLIGMMSDTSLYPVLTDLKKRFPQVADNSKIVFPKVEERKKDINLLDNIPNGRCFEDPEFLNYNTTLFDLQFLIDRAISEYEHFRTDMRELLGEEVLTDMKVKCQFRDGVKVYAASAVRRVFIKWVETMIQRVPAIQKTRPYIDFLMAKSFIIDNFQLKSGGYTTAIQDIVIQVILALLEGIKFNSQPVNGKKTFVKNKDFGFFIYDLLRCKVHRSTPEQIMQLVDNLDKTPITSSGKKLQVVRIKNRFKTPNRDLMVNFQYGQVIVAEAQLCVDSSDVDQKSQKTNKFNHYLYELERGLLGPTIQLMMQHEDFNLPNLTTKMYSEGNILNRSHSKSRPKVQASKRKCLNNHPMIEANQNYYIQSRNGETSDGSLIPFSCDFCMEMSLLSEKYHYCEKCSMFFCSKCNDQGIGKSEAVAHCGVPAEELEVSSEEALMKKIGSKKMAVLMLYLPGSSASLMLRDYVKYRYQYWKLLGKEQVVLMCDATNPQAAALLARYRIDKFPTTMLVDTQGNMLKAVVGVSIDAITWMESLLTGQPTDIGCMMFGPEGMDSGKMTLCETDNKNWVCFLCRNTPIIDPSSLSQAQLKGPMVHQCDNCETVICVNCAFVANDSVNVYEDAKGSSYLSSRVPSPAKVYCSAKHLFIVTHTPPSDKQVVCGICLQKFQFNSQHGMGQCQPCQQYCCQLCLNLLKPAMKHRLPSEKVNHRSQKLAPELKSCMKCTLSLKYVYELRLMLDSTDKLTQKHQLGKWKCCSCQRTFEDGILHASCTFCCLEMCQNCLQLNHFKRKLDARQVLKTTHKCSAGHDVFRTCEPADPTKLRVSCVECQSNLYPNSEHFSCKECKEIRCLNCGLEVYPEEDLCMDGHEVCKWQRIPIPMEVKCSLNEQHNLKNERSCYMCPRCPSYIACSLQTCYLEKQLPDRVVLCKAGHPMKPLTAERSCKECNSLTFKSAKYCEECKYTICPCCISYRNPS